ncbi:MAG: hypothetical protein ACLP05_05030 [Candidatus Kryptoniota bacterium]
MAISPIDPTTTSETTKEIKKKVNASETQSVQNTSDKVELSPEAKKLHEAQLQNKLSEISGKIESGYYSSDEVLNSVASTLVKVLRNG